MTQKLAKAYGQPSVRPETPFSSTRIPHTPNLPTCYLIEHSESENKLSDHLANFVSPIRVIEDFIHFILRRKYARESDEHLASLESEFQQCHGIKSS